MSGNGTRICIRTGSQCGKCISGKPGQTAARVPLHFILLFRKGLIIFQDKKKKPGNFTGDQTAVCLIPSTSPLTKETVMAGKVIDLTDGNFGTAVSKGVTLVDFWAPWCPPCRAQGPIVEKLADAFDGKAVIAKVNVDEQGDTAGKYGVSSIPTLIVLKDGKEVKRFVGLQDEEELTEVLDDMV